MKPKEFPEQNVVFAKDQSEYQPLPAFKTTDGIVTTCWELTDEELEEIKKTKCLYLSTLTFNHPLQPVFLTVDKDEALDLETCENCGEKVPFDITSSDADYNRFCPECWKELEPILRAEYEEMKRNGELD